MSKTHLLYTSGLDQQRTCNHSTLKCKSYIPLYHRNPDGDKKPWCFIKKDKKLRWDHCSVRKCPTPGKTDNKVTVWFIIWCFSIKSSNSITLTYSSSMAFRVTWINKWIVLSLNPIWPSRWIKLHDLTSLNLHQNFPTLVLPLIQQLICCTFFHSNNYQQNGDHHHH